MPDVLIYADTVRSPELRHEIPKLVPDPFLYVERNGDRHIVVSSMEIPVLKDLDGFQLHPLEEFGVDELRRSGHRVAGARRRDRACVRSARSASSAATVPASFPVLLADRLRDAGIELTPDRASFDRRRRAKSGAELEGIRRAQAASDEAMGAARDLIFSASPNAERRAGGGRRAAHERAREGRDPRRLPGEERGLRRLHRLARRAVGDRPQPRRRRDPRGRADRDRHLAEGQRVGLLRRHDADVRRRRRAGRGRRVAPPRARGAGARARRDPRRA